MKKYACLSLLFITGIIASASSSNITVRIAKFKGDKACAISYTFDDGLMEHYTLLAPELDKRGIKGTFYINGSKINPDNENITDSTRMSWLMLKEMSDNGHEISNHGWEHKNFGRHTLDEIREDIYKNDSAIIANIGIWPPTFCYPNNSITPEGKKIAMEKRVGSRTRQRPIGSKSTPEDLTDWVGTLIESKDWGVGMTHGITYGYDAFGNPQRFWEHLDYVKTNEDKIWIATFKQVAAYEKERDNIRLETIVENNTVKIIPLLDLNKKLFDEMLTMVIEKKGVKTVSVKQNGKLLNAAVLPDKILFDFDPYGGEISVLY